MPRQGRPQPASAHARPHAHGRTHARAHHAHTKMHMHMHTDAPQAVMKKLITNAKYNELVKAGKMSVKVNPDKTVESKGFLGQKHESRPMPAGYSGLRR